MDILSRPVLPADHRLPYGPDPSQFGDLWLPASASPKALVPLVVFFHGGWWKSEYDLGYAGYLCAALKKEGIAVWSVEYRRIGPGIGPAPGGGGGYPTTFQDAAAGFDHIATLARQYPLDLTRVITVGHSAGGHLAFWLAGRHHLEPHSTLQAHPPSIPLVGCIALAGAVDLRLTIDLAGYFTFAHDKQEVVSLMGGTPRDQPERFRQANPGDLLTFNIPQVLIQGAEDDQIPPALPARWADNARRLGDRADITLIPGADHFDVVDPDSRAWPAIRTAVQKLLSSHP